MGTCLILVHPAERECVLRDHESWTRCLGFYLPGAREGWRCHLPTELRDRLQKAQSDAETDGQK